MYLVVVIRLVVLLLYVLAVCFSVAISGTILVTALLPGTNAHSRSEYSSGGVRVCALRCLGA